MIDPDSIAAPLAIALGCGAVIGLERGWQRRDQPDGSRTAGLRTFSLLGLLGGIAGLASGAGTAAWPLAAAVLVTGGLFGLGYWREVAQDGDISLTTAVAGVLTVLLGGAATMGFALPAAMAAVVTTVILSAKPVTHRLLTRIDAAEIQAALRLLLISVVILPVLPDQGYGPYQALNPFKLWLMVVAISGLSFLGYVIMRVGNAREGILLTGLFGGLVSSTATTLALSRMAARQPDYASVVAAGAVMAWLVMCARIGLIAYVFDEGLAIEMLPALAAMAVVGLALMLWFMRRRLGGAMEPAEFGNPFEIGSAIRFALFLGAVLVLTRWVEARFGAAGLEALGVISGIADVDAITLSMASAGDTRTVGDGEAARVILLAAITNNLVKAGLGTAAGGRAIATRLIPSAVAMTIAAAVVMFWA